MKLFENAAREEKERKDFLEETGIDIDGIDYVL